MPSPYALVIGGRDSGQPCAGSGMVAVNDNATLYSYGGIRIGNEASSSGVLNVCGNGTVTCQNVTSPSNYADFEIKCPYSGTGVMTIGNGTPTNNALVDCNAVSVGCTAISFGTINLHVGGTLATNFIHTVGTPSVSIVNFDGGTLQAKSNDSNAVPFISNPGGSLLFKLYVLADGYKPLNSPPNTWYGGA